MSSTTGFEKGAGQVRSRRDQEEVRKFIDIAASPTESAKTFDGSLITSWRAVESVVMPILFTAIAAYTRLYKIGAANRVVWDEAHFGKFGSFYLKHEYYFDVHPPLGKMLCGLSGYIAGYNGSFGFESGSTYPEYVNFSVMRQFNAMFSILTVPVAYFSAKALHLSLPYVWLATTMVTLEISFATLARFILLDSMLIFFTTLTFLGLVKFHETQKQPFTARWFFWLFMTGLSIGLTTSVKMVGLFVMALVGIYTIGDLWIRWGQRSIAYTVYALHWLARIVCLILVPVLVFMACFKVHFALLTKTGDGLATMSSLFKANLEGNDKDFGPIDVAYGSRITLKSQGLGGGLLHSHIQTFPTGSKQQQVTTYGHNDANNEWVVEYARYDDFYSDDEPLRFLTDGDRLRLLHFQTGRNLHSHEINAPVSRNAKEVSAYGNETVGDTKDNWVLEIAESLGRENKSRVHPLTTSFRLRHEDLGCYLAAPGTQLPEWGFRQGEVVCLPNASRRNKNTWWNIEQHFNHRMNDTLNRTLPKTKFLRDFVQLNFAQMASNNALVPDPDKRDDLASSWWQWPIAYRGLRMCGWGSDFLRYYLLGTVSTIWMSTAAVVGMILLTFVYLLRWQRGFCDFTPESLEHYVVAGILPLLGWFFHYLPFVIMSRVTYLHHYMPALYFAIFVLNFMLDWFTRQARSWVSWLIFAVFETVTIVCFVHFKDLAFGMGGEPSDYAYLQWFKPWHIGVESA